MARRRDTGPVLPPGVREFTPAELDRIRELTAYPLPCGPGTPHPPAEVLELEAIHAAADRTRTFKVWELGGGAHDAEAAYAEEAGG